MVRQRFDALFSNSRLTGCERVFDLVFDILCVVFHISIMVTEVTTCVGFYDRKHENLFWGSIYWFAMACVCYAVFFAMHITNCERIVMVVVWSLVILPFAPFVPLILFFGTKFNFIDKGRLFKLLNGSGLASPNEGWWRQHLLTKLVANSGFILGIVVDTIPQHAMQVVSIALTAEAPDDLLMSLVLSLCTIATHAFLLSFSIHRPTFVFNYLCFFTDILKLYCTLSWVFFRSPEFRSESAFLFTGGRPLTLVWWYQKAFLCCITFVGLVLLLLAGLQHSWYNYHHGATREATVSRMVGMVWLSLLGIVGFIPLLVLQEYTAFSAIPLFVEKSWKFPYLHARNEMFPKLFRWLQDGDFEDKVWQVNRYYACKFLERSQDRTSRRYIAALQSVRKSEVSMGTASQDDYSRQKKRIGNRITAYMRFVRWGIHHHHAKGLWLVSAAVGFWGWVLVPCTSLSALYTIVYPIIRFSLTPWVHQMRVQRVASLTVLCLYPLMLLLGVSVWRFLCHISQLRQPSFVDSYDFRHITTLYEHRKRWQILGNTCRLVFLANCAHAGDCTPSAIEGGLVLLPELCHLIGLPKTGVLDVDRFVEEPLFLNLAADCRDGFEDERDHHDSRSETSLLVDGLAPH